MCLAAAVPSLASASPHGLHQSMLLCHGRTTALLCHSRSSAAAASAAAAAVLQIDKLLQQSVASGGVLKAALLWMFAHESYPDYDGYTVYGAGAPDATAAAQSAQPVVNDAQSVQVLRRMCAAMASVPAS
jgi:hypothetical protein